VRLLVSILLLAGLSASAGATVIHVPADQPSIQAGIDAAVDGDSVIVACGTYYEDSVTLKSGVYLASETGLADCVIIDAQQQGRTIHAMSLGASTTFRGFTITGAQTVGNGGGMLCSTASLTIDNCRFTGNEAGSGAGIFISSSSSPTITNSRFDANLTGGTGGGVWLAQFCTAEISNCFFDDNEAVQGGGFGAHTSSVVTLTHCTFRSNAASFQGGGLWAYLADLTVDNCIIAESSAGEAVFSGGATLAFSCTHIFGNAGGDWIGDIAAMVDVDGNFSADPQFCGITGSGNVYIQSDSPCAPGNHPAGTACGLIGALPVICSSTATEAITWSRMKSLY
jgi:hypothetical protein